jgi:putative endonuclease
MIGWLKRPRDERHKLGVLGEKAAVKHLRRRGCRILERNWQTDRGEIDLIAEKKGTIHFIEVKTRRSDTHGAPEEAVGQSKQSRVRELAQTYLEQFRQPPAETSFDIVSVTVGQKGRGVDVEWIPAAF